MEYYPLIKQLTEAALEGEVKLGRKFVGISYALLCIVVQISQRVYK